MFYFFLIFMNVFNSQKDSLNRCIDLLAHVRKIIGYVYVSLYLGPVSFFIRVHKKIDLGWQYYLIFE